MRTVITGASRGIGLALAEQLCARGDQVVATTRDDAAITGPTWLSVDFANGASIREMAAKVDAPLDLLVCNAGVYLDKLHGLDNGYAEDLWAQSFAVNVTGVFLTVQALLPQLRAAKSAKIAIISSRMGASNLAPGGSFIYRASKAAAINLGRNLAAELQPERMAVGIYHPGWVQTEMGGKAADLTTEQSAKGLIARFDELTVETSGQFRNYDGSDLLY